MGILIWVLVEDDTLKMLMCMCDVLVYCSSNPTHYLTNDNENNVSLRQHVPLNLLVGLLELRVVAATVFCNYLFASSVHIFDHQHLYLVQKVASYSDAIPYFYLLQHQKHIAKTQYGMPTGLFWRVYRKLPKISTILD